MQNVELFNSLTHRSHCYKKREEYQNAIDDLLKALQVDPKNVITLTELGDLYEIVKEYEKSVDFYTQAYGCNSKDLYVILNKRGRAYLKKNNYEKAEDDITTALNSNPRESEYIFSHALLFYFKGDYESCLEEINTAIEYQLEPNYLYYYYQGLCYKQLKNYDEAIHSIQLASRLKPNNIDCLYSLAELYKDLNNYTDAISNLCHIIEIEPKQSYYLTRGLFYQHEKFHEQAIKDFTKCITYREEDPLLYYYRGISYYCLEKYDESIKDYDIANGFGLETSYYYNNRGKVYVALKKYTEGLDNITVYIFNYILDGY